MDVETAYSAFKYFGEFVSAKKWNYMVREIAAKVMGIQLFEGCSLLKDCLEYRRG